MPKNKVDFKLSDIEVMKPGVRIFVFGDDTGNHVPRNQSIFEEYLRGKTYHEISEMEFYGSRISRERISVIIKETLKKLELFLDGKKTVVIQRIITTQKLNAMPLAQKLFLFGNKDTARNEAIFRALTLEYPRPTQEQVGERYGLSAPMVSFEFRKIKGRIKAVT